MSDQQLYDEIEKIVTALKKVIPVLQNLGDATSDTIDKRLDNSLTNVDSKITNLSHVITKLNEGADANQRFIMSAERQALNHLKQGVELLIKTDVKNEYSDQIARVIANIEPFIQSKINDEVERLIEHKKLSISDHNDQVTGINDKLESNMTKIHETLLESIEKLNTASADANTRYDDDLEQLKQVAAAHRNALQSVKNSTDVTAKNMKTTLTSIKRSAVFISQSPATMTAATACFLALCVMSAIVYRYELWIPTGVAAVALGSFLLMIWGLIAWLDTKE